MTEAAVPSLRLLGYWREVLPKGPERGMSRDQAAHWERLRRQGLRWPDPEQFVDPGWEDEVRTAVVRHLSIGTLVNQYRGLSRCRFCHCLNGSAELTDGAYCWPEGLAHYVEAHAVRLPDEFAAHVMAVVEAGADVPAPAFDANGQRDRSWPGNQAVDLLWRPAAPDAGFGVQVDPDAAWWLDQG